MPGDFRCDRGDYARVFIFITHEAAGALGTRHSLRPLFMGNGSCKTSGDQRREIADSHPLGCLKIKSGKLNEAVAALTLPWRGRVAREASGVG